MQAGLPGVIRTAHETIKLRLLKNVGVGSRLLGVNGSARRIEDMGIHHRRTKINHHVIEGKRRVRSRNLKQLRGTTHCRVYAWEQH